MWSFMLGQLLNPWRAWIRTREQISVVDVTDVSANKSPDQEEGSEAFFGHRALEALLQLGDLTVMGIMFSSSGTTWKT